MNRDGSHQRTLGLGMLALGLVLPFVVGISEGATTALRYVLPLPLLWLGARRTFRLMRASWGDNVAATDGPIFVLSLLLFGLAVVVSYPVVRIAGAVVESSATAVSMFPADVLLLWVGALFMISVSPVQSDRASAPPSR
ncbi:MAG: hypothetical protein QNJ81_09155 [Acidimicrobiia bacterium]|nr:hypothetical protein [Acidimicrobiia bacterium]